MLEINNKFKSLENIFDKETVCPYCAHCDYVSEWGMLIRCQRCKSEFRFNYTSTGSKSIEFTLANQLKLNTQIMSKAYFEYLKNHYPFVAEDFLDYNANSPRPDFRYRLWNQWVRNQVNTLKIFFVPVAKYYDNKTSEIIDYNLHGYAEFRNKSIQISIEPEYFEVDDHIGYYIENFRGDKKFVKSKTCNGIQMVRAVLSSEVKDENKIE